MIRWLWKIIVGKPACGRDCKWQTIKEIRVHGDSEDDTRGFEFVQQCATCGELKTFTALR